jgi:hypothetical protein
MFCDGWLEVQVNFPDVPPEALRPWARVEAVTQPKSSWRKSWENHEKIIGKSPKNVGVHGKVMGNICDNPGEIIVVDRCLNGKIHL